MNSAPNNLALGLVTDTQPLQAYDLFGLGFLFNVGILGAVEIYGFDINTDTLGRGFAAAPIPNNPWLSGKSYYGQVISLLVERHPCTPRGRSASAPRTASRSTSNERGGGARGAAGLTIARRVRACRRVALATPPPRAVAPPRRAAPAALHFVVSTDVAFAALDWLAPAVKSVAVADFPAPSMIAVASRARSARSIAVAFRTGPRTGSPLRLERWHPLESRRPPESW